MQGSVSQKFQAGKPADQQGRFSGRGPGCRGPSFLFGPFLLERNRGAAVQIRTEVAPAASDVVCAADQLPLRGGPGEAVRGRRAFFDDGRDPLITEIPAKSIFTFPPMTSRPGKRVHNPHPAGVRRHRQRPGLAVRWCFLSHFCGQNIGFHRIPRQLIRISDSKSPSPAFLIQEGIGGLGSLRTRQWLFTLADSSITSTPVLLPGRVGNGRRRRDVKIQDGWLLLLQRGVHSAVWRLGGRGRR